MAEDPLWMHPEYLTDASMNHFCKSVWNIMRYVLFLDLNRGLQEHVGHDQAAGNTDPLQHIERIIIINY